MNTEFERENDHKILEKIEPSEIRLSVGIDTDTPKEIKLTPEGFFYNGNFVAEDKEVYEKFREITLELYDKYKAENNI